MGSADIHFHLDPVCPFAWLTSRWVHQVATQRHYDIEWRLISLRVLNKDVDYGAHFPPDYEAGHNAGLRLLRLCASVRAERGASALDALYTALGQSIFDVAPDQTPSRQNLGTPAHVEPVLDALGLPRTHANALGDKTWDDEVAGETEEILARTGRDVGTPIIHFEPPDGVAFFGPVISRLPSDDEAVQLWDHVVALASFPGFAELKRSLRERPQLRALGVEPGQAGIEEDWHAGSRRLAR